MGTGIGGAGVGGISADQATGQTSNMIAGQAMAGLGLSAIPMGLTAYHFGAMTLGTLARVGGRTAPQKRAGTLWERTGDPCSRMGAGWRTGFGAGRQAFGLAGEGFTGTISGTVRNRGLIGGLGRLAGAGALGISGVALPVAAAYGISEAVSWGGQHIWEGSRRQMAGAALASQIGSHAGLGPQAGQQHGSAMAGVLGDGARTLMTDVDRVSGLAQRMTQHRMFQTTKDIKEFGKKFKEMVDNVKEVSEIMQTSLEGAVDMIAELRQQGFYSSGELRQQAADVRALQTATGMTGQQVGAMGSFGSQTARSMGMRGRFGASFTQRVTGAVSHGMRSGAISEEDVREMGGLEATGARLAARQMQYLSSPRGRMFIANVLGSGTEVDPSRLGGFLGGKPMEQMGTGGANRGLDTLIRAGTREAQESAMQYSGMAMIGTAMAQQRQLYGRVTGAGTVQMLGTMGLSVPESRLLMQQTSQLPELMRRQQDERMSQASSQEWQRLSQYHTLGAWWARETESTRAGLRRVGAAGHQAVENMTDAAMRVFGAPTTVTGGGMADITAARRFARATEGDINLGGGVESGFTDFGNSGRIRGVPGIREQIRDAYPEFVISSGDIPAGQEGDFENLGHGKAIRRSDIARASAASRADATFRPEQRAALGQLVRGAGSPGDLSRLLETGELGSDQMRPTIRKVRDGQSTMHYPMAGMSDSDKMAFRLLQHMDSAGRRQGTHFDGHGFGHTRKPTVLGSGSDAERLERFKNLDPATKARLLDDLNEELVSQGSRIGRSDFGDLIERSGAAPSLGQLTISQERQRFGESLSEQLGDSKLLPGIRKLSRSAQEMLTVDGGGAIGGAWNWTMEAIGDFGLGLYETLLTDGTMGSAALERISNNGEARAAMREYLVAVSTGDAATQLAAADKAASAMGDHAPEFRKFESKILNDPDFRASLLGKVNSEGGLLSPTAGFDRRSMAEVMEDSRLKRVSAAERFQKGVAEGDVPGTDKITEGKIQGYLEAVQRDPTGSQAETALRGIIKQMGSTRARGESMISDREMEILGQLTGESQGAFGLGTIINSLSAASGEDIEEIASKAGLDLTPDQIESIRATRAGSSDRAGKVMGALEESKSLATMYWKSGSSAAMTEGADPKSVAEANTRFVIAVNSFCSKMLEIPSIGNYIKQEAADVNQAHNETGQP